MLEIRGHVVMGFREGEEEQHLIIPEGIEAIAPAAFQNCGRLESVHFPKPHRGTDASDTVQAGDDRLQ